MRRRIVVSESISQLLSRRRWCYWIPADGYVEGHGYRVSIVFEYESGHYPTGDDAWIAGDYAKRKPYFWGHDYQEARKVADDMNQQTLHAQRQMNEHPAHPSLAPWRLFHMMREGEERPGWWKEDHQRLVDLSEREAKKIEATLMRCADGSPRRDLRVALG